jgi:hypothetical protein
MMMYFIAMVILALVAAFDTTAAATVPKNKRGSDVAPRVSGSGPTPMLIPYYDENLEPAETAFGIEKRGYFTCYNTAASSLSRMYTGD